MAILQTSLSRLHKNQAETAWLLSSFGFKIIFDLNFNKSNTSNIGQKNNKKTIIS